MYPILAAARAALLQPLEPLIFSSSALTIAAGAATVVVVLCGIAWRNSSSADEDQWYVLVGSLATRPLRLSGRGDGIYVLRVCVKGAELTPVSSLPVRTRSIIHMASPRPGVVYAAAQGDTDGTVVAFRFEPRRAPCLDVFDVLQRVGGEPLIEESGHPSGTQLSLSHMLPLPAPGEDSGANALLFVGCCTRQRRLIVVPTSPKQNWLPGPRRWWVGRSSLDAPAWRATAVHTASVAPDEQAAQHVDSARPPHASTVFVPDATQQHLLVATGGGGLLQYHLRRQGAARRVGLELHPAGELVAAVPSGPAAAPSAIAVEPSGRFCFILVDALLRVIRLRAAGPPELVRNVDLDGGCDMEGSGCHRDGDGRLRCGHEDGRRREPGDDGASSSERRAAEITGGALVVSSDGRHLYATVGPTVLTIRLDGYQTRLLGGVSLGPPDARCCALAFAGPQQQVLLAACTEACQLTCYRRDTATGRLSLHSAIECPSPACMLVAKC